MPSQHTLERFVAMVEANEHAAAAEAFYADDVVIQENQQLPRHGRAAQVAMEVGVQQRALAIRSFCLRPIVVQGEHVVIRWRFEFDWKDGSRTTMEELAWQRWQGDRIAEETFFYDPAQRVPKRPAQA